MGEIQLRALPGGDAQRIQAQKISLSQKTSLEVAQFFASTFIMTYIGRFI